MPRRRPTLLLLALATCLALVPASGASAHPGEAHVAGQAGTQAGGLFGARAGGKLAAAAAELTRYATPRQAPHPAGPCTEAAASVDAGRRGSQPRRHLPARVRLPHGAGRLHSLTEQLKDRPNVILGEMDVKADIAAVAMTYPQGGVLFFDVSDPSKPQLPLALQRDRVRPAARGHQLRRVRRPVGGRQDRVPVDPEAHAAADAAAEPQRAQPVRSPASTSSTSPTRASRRGSSSIPILGLGGVHTVRSHTIPAGPSSAEPPARRGRVRDLQPERRRDRHREGHEGRRQADPEHRAPARQDRPRSRRSRTTRSTTRSSRTTRSTGARTSTTRPASRRASTSTT